MKGRMSRMSTACSVTSSARLSVGALVIAAAVMAFPNTASSNATTTSTLSGTAWQLVSIDARHRGVTAPDDGTKYTLSFGKDKRALIRADCNRGVASWHEDGHLFLSLSDEGGTLEFAPMK